MPAARTEISSVEQEETKELSLVYLTQVRHMTEKRYVDQLENIGVRASRTSLEAIMENAFPLSTSLGKQNLNVGLHRTHVRVWHRRFKPEISVPLGKWPG